MSLIITRGYGDNNAIITRGYGVVTVHTIVSIACSFKRELIGRIFYKEETVTSFDKSCQIVLPKETKKSFDSYLVQVNFDQVTLGDPLVHAEVIVSDKDGVNASGDLIDPLGALLAPDHIIFRIQRGSKEHSPYKIKVRGQTLEGNQWEYVISLKVEDLDLGQTSRSLLDSTPNILLSDNDWKLVLE